MKNDLIEESEMQFKLKKMKVGPMTFFLECQDADSLFNISNLKGRTPLWTDENDKGCHSRPIEKIFRSFPMIESKPGKRMFASWKSMIHARRNLPMRNC